MIFNNQTNVQKPLKSIYCVWKSF